MAPAQARKITRVTAPRGHAPGRYARTFGDTLRAVARPIPFPQGGAAFPDRLDEQLQLLALASAQ